MPSSYNSYLMAKFYGHKFSSSILRGHIFLQFPSQFKPNKKRQKHRNTMIASNTKSKSKSSIASTSNRQQIRFFNLRISSSPIFLLIVLLIVLDGFQPAVQAMSTWRMRTDKKAMRNSLVRFGKRAYRPSGEAFVSAVDLASADGWNDGIGGARPNAGGSFQAFYAPRQQLASSFWNDQRRHLDGSNVGGGGWLE